jgi:inositol oxygenase
MSHPPPPLSTVNDVAAPLEDLDHWEEFLQARYPRELQSAAASAFTDANKAQEAFRDYEADVRPSVREFYRLNHRYQTFDFVQAKKAEFLPRTRRTIGIWEAMEYLNTLVDDSDPDTDLTQIEHLMQTAEAIRRDGHPRWFILTGLIHDLGKILCLWGEPQWAVVGDTFPVGCAFSNKIVFPEFFADNPDRGIPEYQTRLGIYAQNTGLDNRPLAKVLYAGSCTSRTSRIVALPSSSGSPACAKKPSSRCSRSCAKTCVTSDDRLRFAGLTNSC